MIFRAGNLEGNPCRKTKTRVICQFITRILPAYPLITFQKHTMRFI